MITCFHITQHIAVADGLEEYFESGKHRQPQKKMKYSGDLPRPDPRNLLQRKPRTFSAVPLADFFADGCEGQAVCYSTPFVEKLPRAYNFTCPCHSRQAS